MCLEGFISEISWAHKNKCRTIAFTCGNNVKLAENRMVLITGFRKEMGNGENLLRREKVLTGIRFQGLLHSKVIIVMNNVLHIPQLLKHIGGHCCAELAGGGIGSWWPEDAGLRGRGARGIALLGRVGNWELTSRQVELPGGIPHLLGSG